MFEFVRTHQRLMQFLLLLIIFPSFAFFGLESYGSFQDRDGTIAKVGKQKVTQVEFDEAQRREMDQMRQVMGPQFDSKLVDTPEQRQRLLDSLIAQRAVAVEVARSQLVPSNQAVQQQILGMEGLTTDGKFDYELYKTLLSRQNMTEQAFEAGVRSNLAVQQLSAAVPGSAIVPRTVSDRLSDISQQEREVQQQLFKSADYVAKVKVDDAMIQAYYDRNAARFSIPESASVEYVVLNRAAAEAQISVSDDDIAAYYEQNKSRYGVAEQRRASHILVALKKDASDADKQAARARAEKLLAQVRQAPANFAKIAAENSDDTGTRASGGDLGFYAPGVLGDALEGAAGKLKVGEISDVVQSEEGFHILQVTEIKPGALKPLAEVKDQIGRDIRQQLLTKKYSEMASEFNEIVYDQSDSLKPAADKLKLKIETAANVTRQPNPALGADSPLNNQRLLAALFSDEVVRNKRNTEAVEVAPNVLVAARIVAHKPASKRPLEEVSAEIRERVIQEEAAKLARQAGEARLAALRAKDDAAGFGAPTLVSRVKPGDIDGAALAAVMKANADKLPAYAGAELPQVGYGVYRITRLVQPAANPAQRQAEAQQISGIVAQQESAEYVEALKQKAKVKVLKPVAQAKEAD